MDSLASFSEALGTIRSAKGDFLVHWRGNDGHDSRRIVTPESPSFPRTREHFGTVFLPLYGTFANNEHNAGRQFQLRSSAIWRIGNESEYAGRGHGAIASCASGRAIAYSRGGASCSPRRDQTRWQARHHAPPSSLTKNLIWRQRNPYLPLKEGSFHFYTVHTFLSPETLKDSSHVTSHGCKTIGGGLQCTWSAFVRCIHILFITTTLKLNVIQMWYKSNRFCIRSYGLWNMQIIKSHSTHCLNISSTVWNTGSVL